MHPLLFEIYDPLHLKVHIYGLLYAVGFMLGLWIVRRESKRVGLNPEAMTDLFFYILVTATVTSRLFYVFVEDPGMLRRPLDIFKIWEGGLTFYGGLIGAFAVSVYYCRKRRLPFFKVADVYALGASIGHAVGRIGCFFAGCCYGKTCDPHAWYAVVFPETKYGIAPPHVSLYPTQLMESLGEFLIFAALLAFRRKKTFDGQVFLLYVVLYSVMRSAVEIFRGDEARGYVIPGILSTSQFISLIVITAATGMWIWKKKQSKQASN